MKRTFFLLMTILAIFSAANAQNEIKQNFFEQKTVFNSHNSPDSVKRIDPNFPIVSENSPKPMPQTTPYVRPNAKTRAKRYFDAAFGVSALVNSAAVATFGTITNSPKEWHGTAEGFGKRFASGYAQGVISRTVTYGINETFKLDNHFEKSGQTGFSKRFKHVLKKSFATRTEKGKYIPDFPQFIGTYTGNIIAKETWYPKRYTYKDGLTGGTLSIFARLGVHFIREFFF